MAVRTFIKLAAIISVCLPSIAVSQISDRFHFSGFASFVAAKSLKKDALYGDVTAQIPFQTELQDYSKLGLRMTVDLHDKLELTAQLLADGQDGFDPTFDWIFLSYHITPNLSLGIGKYVTSYFMYSDYADISYAYQWVDAPNAVYGTNINKTLEGAKLVWNNRLGAGWTSELTLMAGKDTADLNKVNLNSQLQLDQGLGLAWQIERDWFSVRLSYMHSKTSADLTGTQLDLQQVLDYAALQVPAIQALNSDYSALLNNRALKKAIDWNDDATQFIGFGTALNFSRFFAIAELTYSDIRDTISNAKQSAGYLSLGAYLPHKTAIALTLYEKRNDVNQELLKTLHKASDALLGNPNYAGYVAASQTIENTIYAVQKGRRDGLSLSLRWDFHNNAALKAEYLYEWQKQYNPNPTRKIKPQALRISLDLAF